MGKKKAGLDHTRSCRHYSKINGKKKERKKAMVKRQKSLVKGNDMTRKALWLLHGKLSGRTEEGRPVKWPL